MIMKKAAQNHSEITEEDDEWNNPEVQKDKIRRIIEYQKSLYYSSSSSFAASCSSLSSSSKRSNLLDLMKGGSTSLRRLFDMEHTHLSTHFNEYSGSPIIKPIYLLGSDEDEDKQGLSPWTTTIKRFKPPEDNSAFEIDANSAEGDLGFAENGTRNKRPLSRTKSFRILPGFGIWRCRGLRLRLRRLRVVICRRKL